MPKKIQKEEELPTFLQKLASSPEELDFQPNESGFDKYLGPVFFGGCHQYHPEPHSLNLRNFHLKQFTESPFENTLESILLPVLPIEKERCIKHFHPWIRRPKFFVDHYCHQCPGVWKRFAAEIVLPVVDLGETASKIQGETSREIPMCRLKRMCSRTSEEFEIVTLSDIRERKVKFMSREEQSAHSHFLKEFATVRVIGPKIPAPIIITQMPSMRKRLSDLNFSLPSKIRKTSDVKNGEEGKMNKKKSAELVEEEKVATLEVESKDDDVIIEESQTTAQGTTEEDEESKQIDEEEEEEEEEIEDFGREGPFLGNEEDERTEDLWREGDGEDDAENVLIEKNTE